MMASAAEGAGWTWGFSLLAPGLYSNRAQYLGSSRWRLHGHASKNADPVVSHAANGGRSLQLYSVLISMPQLLLDATAQGSRLILMTIGFV